MIHKRFAPRNFLRGGVLLFGVVVFALSNSFGWVATVPTVSAAPGINRQIPFQGRVVNLNGTTIVAGSYSFTFSLYTQPTGGSVIWTETKTLSVTNSIFGTNLGSSTAIPGSVDFNQNQLYLGINFNGDGEMTPRIEIAAVPQAINAEKVGGLTVTNTTGTLTIPNSATVSFGASFTTSANPLSLVTTGATSVTLPTTGVLATLAGSETLTNKTLGVTTFTGNLTPSGSVDLGATGNRFSNLYVATADATNLTVSGTSALGTVTGGTWQGSVIAAQYGGTGLNTSAATGIPVLAGGTWSVLANGSNTQCLIVSGGVPTWGSCSAGGGVTGSGLAGQLSYWDTNTTLANAAGLTWNAGASQLGIGTASTIAPLTVRRASSGIVLAVRNTADSATVLSVNDTGDIAGNSLTVGAGLTVSAGTVSLPAGEIGNAELANSSLTVSAGTNLSGGGSVSLGGSTTLNVIGNPSFATSVTAPTINATTSLQLNGVSVNTSGTLSNVAYLAQANAFTQGLSVTSATTPQLSVRNDASNRLDVSTSATGQTTLTAVGSNPDIILNASATGGDISLVSPGGSFSIATSGAIGISNAGGGINVASNGAFAIDNTGTQPLTLDVSSIDVVNGANITGDGTSTITGFIWGGTTISPTAGGTGLTSYVTGDILYASGTDTLARRAIGSTGDCLVVSAGVPTWGSCAQSSNTLQAAYGNGNTIALTDARDFALTLANTTTDSNVIFNIATGSTGKFAVQNNGTDVFEVDANGTTITSGGLTVTAGTVSLPAGEIGNAELANSSLTVTAGTGLSGGGVVSLGGSTSLSLPNVGSANTYGSASQVPVFTTDAQGRVTGVTPTSIALAASAITTGQLTPARGGTGFDSSSSTGLPYISGGAWSAISNGSNNQCLVISGGVPTWGSCSAGGGVTGSGSTGSLTYWDTNTTIASASGLNFASGALAIGTATTTNGTFTVTRGTSGIAMAVRNTADSATTFSVSDTGAIIGTSLGLGSGTITSGLINSQTISSAANFTGSLTVANGLTVTAGAVSLPNGSIDNAELANASLTVTAGTNLSGGGSVSLGGSTTLNIVNNPTFSGMVTASGSGIGLNVINNAYIEGTLTVDIGLVVTGGIDNNSGGITEAGTISGATISGASNTLSNIGNGSLTNSSLTVTAGTNLSGGGSVSLGGSTTLDIVTNPTFTGLITGSNTGGTALALTGAPGASGTQSLLRLGNAIVGGDADGTFIGLNAISGYTGNLVDLQLNGVSEFSINEAGNVVAGNISAGTLTAGTYNGQTISSSANFTGSLTVANGFTVTAGAVSLPAGSVANAALANSSITVTAGTGLSGGGSVALGSSVSLSLPNVGSIGTYGSATQVPVFTTDAQGRITGVTNTTIAGIDAGLLDGLDSTDFLRSTASTTFSGTNTRTLTVTSSLAAGARSTALLNITQADNVTNDSTAALLNITNSDEGSTVSPLTITTVSGGSGVTITTPTSVAVLSGDSLNLTNNASTSSVRLDTASLFISPSSTDPFVIDNYYDGISTLSLVNSYAASTLNLDLTDGNLTTAGTTRLTNGGVLQNVTYNGGVIGAQYGGTGQSSYAVGDLLYASGTTALSKLAAGTNGQCLVLASGVPSWSSCATAAVTLQAAYDNGNTIALTNARNLGFTLQDTATDPNFLINIASGSTGKFAVQDNGSDILTVTSASGLSTTGNANLAGVIIGGASAGGLSYSAGGATAALQIDDDYGNSSYQTNGIFSSALLDSTYALSISSAGTSKVVIENPVSGQVADLDLVDGSLQTAGTTRLTNAGALTNITGITTTGGYTQSGTTANTFTGVTTLSAAGTALSVTNDASIGGTLAVTGAINGQTISSAASFTGTVAAATSFSAPLYTSTGNLALTAGGTGTLSIATSNQTTLASGALTISSGSSNLSSSGSVTVTTGSTTNVTTGALLLSTGTTLGTSGAITIDSGYGDLVSGSITIAGTNAGGLILGRTGLQAVVPGTLAINTAASALRLGSGANATTLTSTATTARAISFPDAAGTLALLTSNVTSATNLAGGAAGQVPYQSGAGATAFVGGLAGQVFVSNGSSAPGFVNLASTITAGTNISITGTTNPTINVVTNPTFSGLVTAQLGLNVTGGITDINVSSNFATNINTGTSTGDVTIGNSTNNLIVSAGNLTVTADASIAFDSPGSGQSSISTAMDELLVQAGTNIVLGSDTSIPSGWLTLGGPGGTASLNLAGSTSGVITILPQAAAGTYNFNLPTTAGTSGFVLTSAGGGSSPMTWTDPAALAVRWNSIANPTGNQSLSMGTNTTSWNYATGTGSNDLFNLTTDPSANGTGSLLNIQTGASSTVNPVRVRAGSVESLFVNASGNVGIGTTAPGSNKLAISTDGTSLLTLTHDATNGLIGTSAGALNLRPASGIVALNTTATQNRLRIFGSGGTNYAELTNDNTNTILSSSSGELQLQGSGTNQFILGSTGSAMNLIFEESSTISGQGTNTITLGQSGDIFNLNAAGVAYNVGTLTSTGATLATTNTGNVAFTINGPSGLSANLLNLAVNGSNRLTVTTAGALSTVSSLTSTVTGANALALTGAPLASTTASLLQLGGTITGGSASGTFIGINTAGGFSGNLVDFQINGTNALRVTAGGQTTAASFVTSTATADAFVASSTSPTASATSSLLRLGNALAVGSSAGNFIGVNAGSGFTGNFLDLEKNGVEVVSITADAQFNLTGEAIASTSWSQVSSAGLGVATNTAIPSAVTFNDALYYATTNTTLGTQVYRSTNGTSWSLVNTSGFGSTSNTSSVLTASGGTLFAATTNTSTGSQVWSSTDGSTWTQVNISGFGSAARTTATAITSFGGATYVSTGNGETFRSFNGTNWTLASDLGGTNGTGVRAFFTAQGFLYAGSSASSGGGILQRTSNGTTWSTVGSAGLGDTNNTEISIGMYANGAYYFGTRNAVNGTKVYRSYDLSSFTQVNTNGFGTSINQVSSSIVAYNGGLYIGTTNNTNGTQFFYSATGSSWTQVNTNGFGSSSNTTALTAVNYNGRLLVSVSNSSGAQVWTAQTGVIRSTTGGIAVKSAQIGDVSIENATIRGVSELNAGTISAQSIGVKNLQVADGVAVNSSPNYTGNLVEYKANDTTVLATTISGATRLSPWSFTSVLQTTTAESNFLDTTAAANTGSAYNIFRNSAVLNDRTYFGFSDTSFTSVMYTETSGSGGGASFEVCTALTAGVCTTWTAISGGSDTTTGMTASGTVSWTNTLTKGTVNGVNAFWLRMTVTSGMSAQANGFIRIGTFASAANTGVAFILQAPYTTSASNWNSAGTFIGVNRETSFSGNFLDLKAGGTSVFTVSSAGGITVVPTSVSTTVLAVTQIASQTADTIAVGKVFVVDTTGKLASAESLPGVPLVGVDANSGATRGDLISSAGPLRPSAGAGLTLNVSAGSAYTADNFTGGSRTTVRRCVIPSDTTIAMTASTTEYVYLIASTTDTTTGKQCTLAKSATLPAFNAQFPVLTIAKVVSGASITSVADTRFFIGARLVYATSTSAVEPGSITVQNTGVDNQVDDTNSAAATGVTGITAIGNTASGIFILNQNGVAWAQAVSTASRGTCAGTSTTTGSVNNITAAVTACVGRLMTNAASATPAALVQISPN